MQIASLIGRKVDQTQGFLEDGRRVPLSIISIGKNVVTQVKTSDRDGYTALQVGFGSSKKINKPTQGHLSKAGIQEKPRFFREIKAEDGSFETGSTISAVEVFEAGDIVDVEGISKGKGFAGVVKRHGFHGGPKTHGQSDRHRAPGAIGQGTTPGRVYKGKKMAGRMGNAKATVKNLLVLDVQEDAVLVKGLVPGAKGAILKLTKVGKDKKFVPLYSEKSKNLEDSIRSEGSESPAIRGPEAEAVLNEVREDESRSDDGPIAASAESSSESREKEEHAG